MPLRKEHFKFNSNDFQTAENVLAQAEMQRLEPETFEIFQDLVEKMGFERRDVAAKKENKQYVKQGQILVLGDPRTGKTSLINAITGGEFDPQEKKTSGVEFTFIDKKWRTLDLQNLKFGDFIVYSEKSVSDIQFFPRIFNENREGDDNSTDEYRHSLKMSLFLFVLVFPICLGAVFGESMSRWLIYFVATIALLLYACLGKCSITLLIMLFFKCLATSLALRLFGCSDKSVPMRFSLFLNKLVTAEIIPLFVMNPMIFFGLEYVILICLDQLLDFMQILLNKLPITETLFLNFVFRYREEVLQPIVQFLNRLIFFAPIGLSCYRSSIVFPFECVCIFLMHVAILYHQNILLKRWTIVVLILELAIAIPLCFTALNEVDVTYSIMAVIFLLSLGVGLHVHGNWLQFKDDFKGKSFAQVVFKKDFLLHVVQIKKTLIDMKRLKNALNDKFCNLTLKILDFAGDEEYYAYHQIFLNSDALYLIVFNIKEYIEDHFKNIEATAKRLRFWLESIHSHVPEGTPILLVGTHRANIGIDTLGKINSCIRKAIWHTPFNEGIVINEKDGLVFFPVENSNGIDDTGILKLRKKIKSLAENDLKDVFGQEIPLSWIKIQDAIIQYVEGNQGPVCLTVEDFKNRFQHLYIEWNVEMLNYFHKKGFIIYIDKDPALANWVLLKPDVLVQVVILLIRQPNELANKRGQRSHWQLLKNSGTITKLLMKNVLSQVGCDEGSSLMAFLEEYDLLCPLNHPSEATRCIKPIQQTTHFVPSLLPLPSDSKIVWADSENDKKFYIFFTHFLPETLFYRILSRACKLSLPENPRIYRNKGLFWLSPNQPYCLRLLKDEGQIEVTFCPSDTDQQKPFDILVLLSVSIIDSICKRDFQNLSFHCGPECTSPKCPGVMDDSLSHFCDQRRRHVIDVYPTFEPTSFKCLNYYPQDEVKYWFQTDSRRIQDRIAIEDAWH